MNYPHWTQGVNYPHLMQVVGKELPAFHAELPPFHAGDIQAVEDELEELLGPDEIERNVIDGMLQAGRHPKAIINKIERDRR